MKFSILICTYNRHDLLRLVLQAILKESLEKPDEVIVVNGGDEQADQVVHEFQDKGVQVRLIKTKNVNLATSRNIGLQACSGDIIAMTDDDARVFPDWITQMKRAHAEHPEAGAAGGLVIGTNTDSVVGKAADAITFPVWDKSCYVRTLAGVNISYKKEAVQKIGLQDVTLFRGEDVDYNWRVIQAGYKIYFDPAIKVYHHHRPTLMGFLNQHYMYGRAYYHVRRKWPEMYCVYPHGIKSFRDFLKAGHFFVALLYQPFLSACRLSSRGLQSNSSVPIGDAYSTANPQNQMERGASWKDRILSLPLLFTAGIVWKFGMLQEKWNQKRKS